MTEITALVTSLIAASMSLATVGFQYALIWIIVIGSKYAVPLDLTGNGRDRSVQVLSDVFYG